MRIKKRKIMKYVSVGLAAAQCMTTSVSAFAGTWEVSNDVWKYKNDDSTYVKNSWFRDPADKRLYYINEHGIMQSGWKLINGIWYFLTTEHNGFYGAALENTWAWIDGYCYYFGTDGKMAASCTTKDGFLVNDQGQWVENGAPVYIAGKGYNTKPIISTSKVYHGESSSSGKNSSVESGNNDNSERDSAEYPNTTANYSYTIRHINSKNEIMKEESGEALAGSEISFNFLEDSDFIRINNQKASDTLTTDNQVFNLYYSYKEAEPEEETDTACAYTVCYIGTDNEILKSYEGTGKAGDKITIETCTFDGYTEMEEQPHEYVLPAGVTTFTVLYNTDKAANLEYTIRYASMDGVVLGETTGFGTRGDTIKIQHQNFNGFTEIENQSHEYRLSADKQIFSVKYEKNRVIEEQPDDSIPTPAPDPEQPDAEPSDKQERCNYRIVYNDEQQKEIGCVSGSAIKGSTIDVPEIILEGYEVKSENQDAFTLNDDITVNISCSEAASDAPDTASPSDATLKTESYYYILRYCDSDTGMIIGTQSGRAAAGAEIIANCTPQGYTLADEMATYTITATDNDYDPVNNFTVWCVNSTIPEGSIEYTVKCVDPDGRVIKTFTDVAVIGTVITPDYEIFGYDIDPTEDYTFTVTEDNHTFTVKYIPYRVLTHELRVIDIDSGDVLDKKTVTGRVVTNVTVPYTDDDFTPDGYELISTIPKEVWISGNPDNNYTNIYVKKSTTIPIEPQVRPYVIHYVSYHDRTKKISADTIGTAEVGSKVTATFLPKINLADGTYEAIAQGTEITFTMSEFTATNEFYVFYYKTAEAEAPKVETQYSIRFMAEDTGSILGVMTGSAMPGKRISYRNTWSDYDFIPGTSNFFVVTSDPEKNYVTVKLQRATGNPPAQNPSTGKFDGAEWLMTFTDEYGKLLLPWRSGFTRKGDTLIVDYPDTIYGEDGTVYRAVSASPYMEYVNGTVYRQYDIKYKKGEQSENLLEKWQKEAQSCLDEIKRAVPYTYTVTYREKDSWNDIAIYSGIGKKGENIEIQGISIPGYTLSDDAQQSFILDEDKKNVTVYCDSIDDIHRVNWEKNDYQIRFIDDSGNDILEAVTGYMAFETGNSYNYMTLHYPDTFRDSNGDIWEADESSPKQLTMYNLDANKFEIKYHRYYENDFQNFFADKAEDAQRLLREMAVFTVDTQTHSYIAIGRDYDPTLTEVSSVIANYNIANYTTERVDKFELDGVTYYITKVTYNRKWNQENCVHDLEITKETSSSCEVNGLIVSTCKKCGYTETTHIPATGHLDADYDGMCDKCNTHMAMNIGDEITVTWDPGSLDLPSLKLNYVCIDTDYKGTGKKLFYCIEGVPADYYGTYSSDGHADYFSSDLRAFFENEFLDGLSNRVALDSVDGESIGLLTMEQYEMYKAQAANVYKFPEGVTIVKEETGADGLVQLSDGTRVTPEDAANYVARPFLIMGAGGATEGNVSGHWKVGDYQSKQIGDKTYLFRCVNDNYKDNSNLDKSMALFVCDTVLPAYEGLAYNEDDTKRDTRFFGDTNNYRYSNINDYLLENRGDTGNLVTMDIGILNEYDGSTAAGAFEALDERELKKYKRETAQYYESKLFIPSVEEALDMKEYLWKFDRSDRNNIDAVYDGNYLTGYWLRTPVHGTTDMIYTVNLKDGRIEPHSVAEEYAIPNTHASQEYSADNGNTWMSCSDNNTVVKSPGQYLVREKNGGQSVVPELVGGVYAIVGTNSWQEYSADGGNTWNDCSDGNTAVGVSATCLVRVKGESFSTATGDVVAALSGTTKSQEWSADGGNTWNTCEAGNTIVPNSGVYLVRNKDNPLDVLEMNTVPKYPIANTQYGYEYLDSNGAWKLCADGTTYADEAGTYTIRRTEAGVDYTAVKKSCSIGIRPMYSVFQSS